MICLKHQQAYYQDEYCIYCGKPRKSEIPILLPTVKKSLSVEPLGKTEELPKVKRKYTKHKDEAPLGDRRFKSQRVNDGFEEKLDKVSFICPNGHAFKRRTNDSTVMCMAENCGQYAERE